MLGPNTPFSKRGPVHIPHVDQSVTRCRSEWGPRALGNRSILANPRRAGMKQVANTPENTLNTFSKSEIDMPDKLYREEVK